MSEKISELPSAFTSSGNDLYVLVQGGIDKNITFTNLLAAIAYTGPGVTSLSGLAGSLNLVAGPNVSITPNGSNITIGSIPAWNTITGIPSSVMSTVGTNTGNITVAPVGSAPNADAATVSGQILNLQPFNSSFPGVVSASGGGTANFLRADGTWALPPGLVSSIAIASANGLSGSSSGGSNPVLTLNTTITGILYGNGTLIAAAGPSNFPTLNQNTTGTATNITASSNSSLTTLPFLSLPGSQVTGNIPGNSSNITATSNSSLVTLSSLLLPGSQIVGNISGDASNIVASSNSTLTSISSLVLPTSQLSGQITLSQLPNIANNSLLGNNSGSTAVPNALTAAQVNAILPIFTSSLNGLVPLSGGGTVNFLRADGTWDTPSGSGTVASVSVATANGLAGTSSGGVNPQLTLSTNVTGILYGNGTSISPAIGANFPTLNQNTTGTASNVTGTTNSTLATLSALSLPGSQVSGNISGNAANITTTSNSSIITLSSLSLPGSQVSGNISGTSSNITAVSNNTLVSLSSLSLPTSQLSGQVGLAQLPNIASNTFLANNLGSTAVPSAINVAQVNAILPIFTSSLNGLVPLSGGGVSNFLRADGTWDVPSGSGTVASVSVATANGLAGTSSGGSTPQLTLSTSVTGIMYGNGTSIAAAITANFPTLNQNTTGTAANITATSNSTITTLSALTLPTSHLSGQVTLSQLPSIGNNTFLANNSGSTAIPSALTVAQVNAVLPIFTSSLNGLVPLSGGGTANFLRADGTWVTPTGSSYTFANSLVNTSGTVTLVNDSASPGASKYYGTNGSSTLGYFALPGGGTGFNYLSSSTSVYGGTNSTLSFTGADNTVIGVSAGNALTSGQSNTLIGYSAGSAITTGVYNTLIGVNTGGGTTTSSNNTFIGSHTATNTANGGNNTLIGASTANGLTTGGNNVYVGLNSGPSAAVTGSGSNNVAIGVQSAFSMSSGVNNVTIGSDSGYSLGTGGENVLVGGNAGEYITNASYNTYIGYGSGPISSVTNLGSAYNVIVGYNAGLSVAANQNTLIGTESNCDSTANNVAVGFQAEAIGAGSAIAIGALSYVGIVNGMAIGTGAKTSYESISLGNTNLNAPTEYTTAGGQFSIGAPGVAIKDMYLGNGALGSGSPASASIQPSPVEVTFYNNTAGANLTLKGGASTGTGAGGSIIFATAPAGSSGSTGNAQVTVGQITSTGAHTLGAISTTPTHVLNTNTATPASGVGTFTNLPAGYSGNPTGYIQITINGGTHVIPYW